ncbi:FGGY family carbohydrate kinase [Hamadaea sp.]|uniref:FGGY-family carbohydrate kinase n=1 Tax=Hamadaea sp. TaxID=2024425 RepID=UPI0025BE3CB9|nr:FGGY family carbohydrate kinase [Hamadaea sp.]
MGTQHPTGPDLWAGVDVGTQSIRVMLCDEHGNVVGRGAGQLSSSRAGTRHEQDPEQWWLVFCEASRAALQEADSAGRPAAQRVRALAICATSGTFLLADASGRPQTTGLMYDDARAAADFDADRWRSVGHPAQPTWPLPRLAWLLEHGSPELRREMGAGQLGLRHCGDYIAERLTGHRVATDWSHALKTGYDAGKQAWATGPLDLLGLPERFLPEVVRPGSTIGSVGLAGAEHSAFVAGTPIRAGMTDGCAAQIAAGALDPGSWNSVLGTTLVVKGVSQQPLTDPAGVVYSHRHPDQGWLPGGASSVGAGVIEQWFPGINHELSDASAAKYEPAGGILYPLAGRGERFPFVRPDAAAFHSGHFTDDDDRYAAVLQAVAYVEKLTYAHLRRLGAATDGRHYITGGATRSRYWNQLRADILGVPLELPFSAEPAFGMAVLAAAGDGPLNATARRMIQPGTLVPPRPAAGDRFSSAYADFVAALTTRGWIDEDLSRNALEFA